MEDVRCLKQHLEPTHASVHLSQDFGLHRCHTCLLAEGLSRVRGGTRVWCEQNGAGTIWLQRRTFAAAHKQRRSFADTVLGQADKLASSLVPFCSSPAADCSVCLCINEVGFCLKEQLVGFPGELLPPAWWLWCRASSRAGGGRSKRKTPTELLGISSLICWYIH